MPQLSATIKAVFTDGYGQKMTHSPDEDEWVAVSPASLYLWNQEQLITSLPVPGAFVNEPQYSLDGTKIFVGSHVFDLSTHEFVTRPALRPQFTAGLQHAPEYFSLNGAAWAPDGKNLVVYVEYRPPRRRGRSTPYTGPHKRLLLFDGETSELLAVLWEGGRATTYRAIRLSQQYVVACGAPTRIWSRETYQPLAELGIHTTAVRNACFSPDQSLLFTVDWEGKLVEWATGSWQMSQTVQAHQDGIQALAFHPQTSLIVTGGDDGELKFWERADKIVARTTLTIGGRITGVSFHPEGKELIVANDEGKLFQCEISTT